MNRSNSRDEWRRTRRHKALAETPERRDVFRSTSDIELADLYTADDLTGWPADEALGYPGEYPFTRGVQPTMYRGRFWTMRQYAGFGTAEETNARFRYLLGHGQTGLSTAFDMPSLMGHDSDHVRSLGEVGREGVAVSTLADMEILDRSEVTVVDHPTCIDDDDPLADLLAVLTNGGSASAGTDFSGGSGTLTWGNGDQTAKTIALSPIDDSGLRTSWATRAASMPVSAFRMSSTTS